MLVKELKKLLEKLNDESEIYALDLMDGDYGIYTTESIDALFTVTDILKVENDEDFNN